MIDLSWSHILIVVIVALVVIGPKDLPRFMRMAGRWVGKARAMADQFRRSFDEMSRQAELDELRAELNALRNERPLAGTMQKLHDPILPDDLMSAAKPELHAEAPPPEPVGEPHTDDPHTDLPPEPTALPPEPHAATQEGEPAPPELHAATPPAPHADTRPDRDATARPSS